MPQKFTNNARSVLVSAINSTDTSITISSGTGDLFPVANVGTGSVPSTSDWFKSTLQDATGEVEIVYVRTRTSGSSVFANVMRGKEGTAARLWSVGTVIGLRLTTEDIQTAVKSDIDVGTKMVFIQATAPTGWTKLTGYSNHALRLVADASGGTTGGTVDFTTAFSSKAVSGTVGNTTLSLAQMPWHEHSLTQNASGANTKMYTETSMYLNYGTSTQATKHWNDRLATGDGEVKAAGQGGGGAHNHSLTMTALDMAVKYVNSIVCSKD